MPPLVLVPQKFEDARGWFSETWNQRPLLAAGIDIAFCQDNHSLSRGEGTLRGLHFQAPPHAQTKLVRCLKGRIFDVIVDIRAQSPTFGQWVGIELSAANSKQLLVPAGYAHGFVTLEPDCEIAYNVDDYYDASSDGGIIWNDPDIGVAWPVGDKQPILSDKDAALPRLHALPPLFPYDGIPLAPLQEVRV